MNIERVRASVREQPGLSIRKWSSVLSLHKTSLNRILHKDLHLHPFKIQIVQQITSNDHTRRLQFANEMLEKFTSFNNIFFSDEAHFHLTVQVDRQNCRYWSDANPQLKHQKPLHSPKVTVQGSFIRQWHYCSVFLWKSKKPSRYPRHRAVHCHATELFCSSITGLYSGFNKQSWFQQDGMATCHTSKNSIAAVHEIFGQKIIFFLWGYLKSFDNNPV